MTAQVRRSICDLAHGQLNLQYLHVLFVSYFLKYVSHTYNESVKFLVVPKCFMGSMNFSFIGQRSVTKPENFNQLKICGLLTIIPKFKQDKRTSNKSGNIR